ncbi:putative trehalose-6-phosphate synthase domain containing protein [Babesia divergens]|uniref:Trehalose-6-phosphate synthase domain containing protein n=1 Tax=Babesia divergens TaxID=32595 RepID=A0AAD9GFQ6_BABDI|nr:putative trehalose-6-phosphate synthase domain containing protein [Babesia divergens]
MVFYTAVHFRCRGKLEFGNKLAVVGDHVALGNWDVKQAHGLQKSVIVDEVWNSVAPAHLPLKERRQYRYAVLNGVGDFVRWHEEDVRYVEPTGNDMIVEDDYGYFRSECSSFSGLTEESTATHRRGCGSDDDVNDNVSLKVIQLLQRLDVDPTHNVYFVTSRLPIQVYRRSDGSFDIRHSNTPLTTTLWHVRHRYRNKMRFIGSCMIVSGTDDPNCDSNRAADGGQSKEAQNGEFTDKEKVELRRLLLQHDCIPVFIPTEEQNRSLQFCKEHLWNLFYNIGLWDVNEQNEFNWGLWNAYASVNRKYAAVVTEYASETDFFWVHDYKLLMVPHFITRKMKRANIGIFMHAMFPPYSLFACLAVREALLRSMLCADLIGFQFFGFARHFLTCCKRLLGLDHTSKPGGMLDIEYNGREVMILLSHTHIQPELMAARLDEKSGVPALVDEFRQKWNNRFIVASVDRDIRLAGLFLKFKAFRKYLSQYPDVRGKVLLVQYVCAADTLWECRTDVVATLKSMVESINAEYGETHIILQFNVGHAQKYALFVAADCFLDTSIRGGINMCALEYIYCRQGKPASAIISEFVGFSKMLLSAIRVNPWHVESVMDALDNAMSFKPEDRIAVCKRDFEYIVSNDTVSWVDHFVRELFCARKKQDMLHRTWGFGKTYRTYSVASGFQLLDTDHVVRQYQAAKRRLIFLDCEGTLCPSIWENPPRSSQDFESTIRFQTAPLECNVASIQALASNPLNVVVVISGQNRNRMENLWFPDQQQLGICAGYGLYYRVPSITGNEWVCMLEHLDEKWKEPVLQIMEQYVHRTPGSYVENMDIMVVFQYHHTDPEFGATQSNELCTVLRDIMAPYPVDVQWSKWNVQVKHKGISKGAAFLNIAERSSAIHGDFDFVLCIGDHRSDEEMFKALETLDRRIHGPIDTHNRTNCAEARYISCTVGMKPSKAMYYLNDYMEVSELLSTLTHY